MRPPLSPPEILDFPLSDGYVARGRLWRAPSPTRPAAAPRIGIIYLHGIQSHGGWYERSAALIANVADAVVLMPDRRGSGLNSAARGDTPGWRRWIADIDDHANWLREEDGIECVALVGVSWGGKPASGWALENPQRTAGLLLIAPGVFPQVDVRFSQKIGVGVSLLTDPQRQFPIPLSDPALFTDNPVGRTFIRDDPLKLSSVTARFMFESTRLDRMLIRAAAGSLHAPATLLLAERDRIIRNEPTARWLRRLAARSPAITTIAQGGHTLEFEPGEQPGSRGAIFEQVVREWAQSFRATSAL